MNSLKRRRIAPPEAGRSPIRLSKCGSLSLPPSESHKPDDHHESATDQHECSQFGNAWHRTPLIEILGLIQATCTFRVIVPVDGCIVRGVIIDPIAGTASRQTIIALISSTAYPVAFMSPSCRCGGGGDVACQYTHRNRPDRVLPTGLGSKSTALCCCSVRVILSCMLFLMHYSLFVLRFPSKK